MHTPDSGAPHIEWHRPTIYRYRVAVPGIRVFLNRYPGVVIGAGMTLGRFAYCVKWGWVR